ncbi:MAG: trypsin-like peptidase domain-containing protein, partial [Acidimicrobiia bacterium]
MTDRDDPAPPALPDPDEGPALTAPPGEIRPRIEPAPPPPWWLSGEPPWRPPGEQPPSPWAGEATAVGSWHGEDTAVWPRPSEDPVPQPPAGEVGAAAVDDTWVWARPSQDPPGATATLAPPPVETARAVWEPATAPAPPAERRSLRPWAAAALGALVGALVASVVAVVVADRLADDPAPASSPPLTTASGALDIRGILDKVQPSVVTIELSQRSGQGVFGGAGSGIVLSEDGLVLTNAHVVSGGGQITGVLFDGSEHAATLVGSLPEDDLAIIRLDGVDDLVPAELGSSAALRVGDPVIAIGNALNLGGDPTVTLGIVSATDRR